MTPLDTAGTAASIDSARARASARRSRLRSAIRRRPSIPGVLLTLTVLLHAAGVVALAEGARWLGLPWPWLLAVLAASSLALAFRPLVLDTFPDLPRSRWRVAFLELPYLAHWCALVPVLVVLPVGLAIWALQSAFGSGAVISVGAWALYAYGAGVVLATWGVFVRRHLVRVRRKSIRIAGLGEGFAGYRIVHLSDLHIGSFATPAAAQRWVRKANELDADLVVVTGDLVSGGVEFHPSIAEVVKGLRATDGVAVIPGNHDYFGDGFPLFRLLQEGGVHVLRNDSIVLERGGAQLLLAGVDDAWTGRTDLERALSRRRDGVPTVLLAHNPILFPDAVRARVELVLSGHTHGGQIAFPFLARWINVSAWAHRYQVGEYREGGSTLVVSAGLGTTGPPIRIGVAPEVGVIELLPSTQGQL